MNQSRTTYLNRLHQQACESLKLPTDFVLHSLRHTMFTRLGRLVWDVFTIMRIAVNNSITISQRYVHVSPASLEHVIEKRALSTAVSAADS